MLKGISPLLSPDLLKTIAEMGHGDELVIGDGNFPAASVNARCLRCDGHGVPELLEAILALFPLDEAVEAPVTLMAVTPGDGGTPPIWEEYARIVEKHQPGTKIQQVERFAFYDLSRKAYATVQTGESALFANIVLKKGAVKPQ